MIIIMITDDDALPAELALLSAWVSPGPCGLVVQCLFVSRFFRHCQCASGTDSVSHGVAWHRHDRATRDRSIRWNESN